MGAIERIAKSFFMEGSVMEENFKKVSVKEEARVELHDALGLTGAEISLNLLPQGASVPFVHSHRKNEEIYGILEGEGYAEIDGERIPLAAGDWLRIAPAAKRRFFASETRPMKYLCIQVKAGSLEGFTASDAEIG